MAAKSLDELEQLSSDLGGLDVGAEDQHAFEMYRIEQGLRSGDRNQVRAALLQIFRNLGTVHKAVETTVELALGKIEKMANEALDVSLQPTSQELGKGDGAPGRAALPSPETSGNVRWRLLIELERLFRECVFKHWAQIALLETVLMDELHAQGYDYLSEAFRDKVMTLLSRTLLERAQGSSFVKQTLEDEYPEFLRIFWDFRKRSEKREWRDILQPFKNAYLSQSVSRLLDTVHAMFSGDSTPGEDDVDVLISLISRELSVSLVDKDLSTDAVRNVAKAISLFRLKCEQALVTGAEASQVIDSPTPGQQQNVVMANLMHYLTSQTTRVFENFPNETEPLISLAKDVTESLTRRLLTPLLASISDAIESIILTMHDDTEFRDPTSPLGREIGCSLYMRELQDFIARSVTNFLEPYRCHSCYRFRCRKIVGCRCIEFFARHACLVRPLTDYGRAKLVADFGHMEIAVTPLCHFGLPSGLESRAYRTLRALRALLCLGPEEMVHEFLKGEDKGDIPASLVLLYLFSGAPAELQSPHQSAGWSIRELSQWMDAHTSESERLALCTEPLQRYQTIIRARNPPTFHHLFPLMMKLANLDEEPAT